MPVSKRSPLQIAILVATLALALTQETRAGDSPVSFNRDIRPILADRCFHCHGPDEKQRQGELRLDTPDGHVANREAGPAVIPGKPDESELWRRITSSDPAERMPPADSGKSLSESEIATLKAWIIQGAKWEKHWSFLPVQRPHSPLLHNPQSAIRNALDSFILARLEAEELAPSLAADKPTILRRVTLDLTGLPPTPDEIAAFAADPSPDAYERVVDRLLASPRYGERMAAPWLDAARYADTHGYQSDGERVMWRWRDWVIEVLNGNMPFDQFTVEQLAGDLLENPTLDQRIATGFNRNHRGNSEGGIIPEEYAVEYVVDRVETTTTVWLGLTLGCARCHDHKFDPFSQREFYSLYAFFNNVPEKGRAIKIGNSPPYIKTPTRLQAEQLKRVEQKRNEAQSRLAAFTTSEAAGKPPKLKVAMQDWAERFEPASGLDWHPTADLVAAAPLEGDAVESVSGKPGKFADGSPVFELGIVSQAARFDGKCCVEIGDVANFGFQDKFVLAAWVFLPESGGGTVVSRMTDVAEGDGYQLAIVDGKLQLNLAKRWLDDALRVETAKPLTFGKWHHVMASYDGSRVADGVALYVDGRLMQKTALLDELNQSFAAKQPLRIGGGGGPAMRFRGLIDEVRVYDYFTEELLTLAAAPSIASILANPRSRSELDEAKLKLFFLYEHAAPEMRSAYLELANAERELTAFEESLPTTMVMQELPTPRQAHVLLRGQYDKPGEPVNPGVPAELPALPTGGPRNRLALAQWLVDPRNPLTARVTINRAWQLYFGAGLVKTAEDFGRQGEWPTHPELLDWLAAEFMDSGWNVKALQRLVVTSSTYRQSSAVTPALLARDPDNRLLARGPRLRLSAEMVRDQALAASGLFVEQVGGPSVRPLQPPGLWSELTGGEDYTPGTGADLYRRSLYTFWKRTIPPPSMAAFDASSREFCTVREGRTNTPLQALALMNEETYVAAARSLAMRVLREKAETNERLKLAMLLVIGREPKPEELAVLAAAVARHRQRFVDSPAAAEKLLAVGPASASVDSSPADLAAYTLVCATILNLDEAVTRQ